MRVRIRSWLSFMVLRMILRRLLTPLKDIELMHIFYLQKKFTGTTIKLNEAQNQASPS